MKIYVGNLPIEVTDAQFTELARPFGGVTASNVVRGRTTGDSRGFGFLEFGSAEDGKAAIAGLNGKDVRGRMLRVSEARVQTQAEWRY